MNHSKRYVLPLVALCVLLVGAQAAFGQATLTVSANLTSVRNEGITETIGQINLTNSTSATQTIATASTLLITFNATITNSAIAVGAPGSTTTNVTTTAGSQDLTAAPAATVARSGATLTITFNQATPIITGGSLIITGVRVNVSGLGVPAPAGTTVTAAFSATPFGAMTFAGFNPINVGIPKQTIGSVTRTALTTSGAGVTVVTVGAVGAGATIPYTAPLTALPAPILQCAFTTTPTLPLTAGRSLTLATSNTTAFPATGVGIRITEPADFPNSFTKLGDEVNLQGAGPVPLTRGVQLILKFTGLPANISLHVPQMVTGTGVAAAAVDSASLVLTIVDPTTGIALVGASGAIFNSATADASGNASFTYEVTADSLTVVEQTTVPVFATVASGTVVPVGPFGSVAVSAGALSTVTTFSTAAADAILRFTDNPRAVSGNLFTNSACITTLLFPYVINSGNFDTGIEIANTANDGAAATGGIGTTGQTGPVTLRFFGTGVPAAAASGAGVALAIPATSTGGSVAVANVMAPGEYALFLASQVAPGFVGYMTATCNFLFAHGYAIVTNGFGGTPTGLPINGAYLPLTLPSPRAASVGAPETRAH